LHAGIRRLAGWTAAVAGSPGRRERRPAGRGRSASASFRLASAGPTWTSSRPPCSTTRRARAVRRLVGRPSRRAAGPPSPHAAVARPPACAWNTRPLPRRMGRPRRDGTIPA
jgi:hypothetical protein